MPSGQGSVIILRTCASGFSRKQPVRIFVLVFSLLTTNACFAQQSIDLLTLSGRLGFPSEYDGGAGTAKETGALANFKLPLVFNSNTIWYSNFTYTYSGVNFSQDLPLAEANPIRLHAFVLQTGLVQRFNPRSAIQVLFVPRYMSDMVNPGADGWQFGTVGLYEQHFGEQLKMRFGALYNDEIAGPLIVPLVGVDWHISQKWSIKGLLPIYGKIKYKINQRFNTGISFFGLFTSYDLTNPVYSHDYMERSSIDISAFLEMNLAGNIFVEGRLGYALARKYEQFRDGSEVDFRISIIKFGDNRGVPLNQQFGDGLIANLRVVYRLDLE